MKKVKFSGRVIMFGDSLGVIIPSYFRKKIELNPHDAVKVIIERE